MGQIRDTLEDIRDFAIIIASAPTTLKTSGAFVQGISKTIANPKVAQVIYKGGTLLRSGGAAFGKVLKAGTTAVARASAPIIKSTATTVAKSLPGSKLILPIAKYIPTAAVAAASAVLGAKAKKQFDLIKEVKSNPIAKLNVNRDKFNIMDPISWTNLLKEAFSFK
jgi:hypothetical protein